MCGRFTLSASPEVIERAFGLDETPQLAPRFNIAPDQAILTLRREDGSRLAEMMRWGLVPSWAKDRSKLPKMINARAETIATKPAYRTSFRRRRCLILADGFYEWKPHPKRRKPHHVRLSGGELFGFAGLYEHSPVFRALRDANFFVMDQIVKRKD